jgi:hypothetical protein
MVVVLYKNELVDMPAQRAAWSILNYPAASLGVVPLRRPARRRMRCGARMLDVDGKQGQAEIANAHQDAVERRLIDDQSL